MMTDAPQDKATSALKNKTWIWLVAAFALLVVVGIITS
jgi:hypothetical protein